MGSSSARSLMSDTLIGVRYALAYRCRAVKTCCVSARYVRYALACRCGPVKSPCISPRQVRYALALMQQVSTADNDKLKHIGHQYLKVELNRELDLPGACKGRRARSW